MTVIMRIRHGSRGDRSKRGDVAAPLVMPDIAPFIAPGGPTPTPISSRSELRAHERSYGIRQCGELDKVSDYDWRDNSSDPDVSVEIEWT